MGTPCHDTLLPHTLSHREGPLPARSKLDELLGRGTAAKLLTRPGTGERREFKLDKKYQKPEGTDALGKEEGRGGQGLYSLSLSLPHTPCFLVLFVEIGSL